MHLDELARDEIQRLAVVAGEIQMAHARREHAAADQPSGKWLATKAPGANSAQAPIINGYRPARAATRRSSRPWNPDAQPPPCKSTDLRKTYDNGVEALKGVSLTVEPGDFFALLGPNGAGKSTLIGVVSSLVNASSGSVKVFGVDIAAERSAAMRLIGLVPQEMNFNMFEKPLDILVNYAGFYGMPRAEALVRAEEELKAAQLWPRRT